MGGRTVATAVRRRSPRLRGAARARDPARGRTPTPAGRPPGLRRGLRREGFAEAQALAATNSDPASARLYGEFSDYVERLAVDHSPETFLGSIVAYHLLAEGVVARTAQNLAGDQYARFGNFPGLTQGMRLVAREEARHIGIGVSYVRRSAAADPEGTYRVVASVVGLFAEVCA